MSAESAVGAFAQVLREPAYDRLGAPLLAEQVQRERQAEPGLHAVRRPRACDGILEVAAHQRGADAR